MSDFDNQCLFSVFILFPLGHPGSATCSPGSPLGDGLTQEAAADLGLDPGTAVGASLIDAHAGGLGITQELAGDTSILL